MIANLEEDMEKVIDKLERLNLKLKHTVEKVGHPLAWLVLMKHEVAGWVLVGGPPHPPDLT